MWIKVRIIDSVIVGSFPPTGLTDEEMIQQVGFELMELIEKAAEAKKLLLSFEGVPVMSSAMIGKLVLFNKQAKTRGVQVKFCDINPNVLEVFKITRLNNIFRLDEPNTDDDDDDDDDNDAGNAGIFAKLPKYPGSGGTRAEPPRDNR